MTFSSIFQFKFWFRRGVVLDIFLDAFWRPLRVLRASLRVLGRSLGNPWDDFLGSLEVLLAAVWCLRGPLGIPGGSWGVPGRIGGDFLGFSGKDGKPFGSILSGLRFSRYVYTYFAFILVSFWKQF